MTLDALMQEVAARGLLLDTLWQMGAEWHCMLQELAPPARLVRGRGATANAAIDQALHPFRPAPKGVFD